MSSRPLRLIMVLLALVPVLSGCGGSAGVQVSSTGAPGEYKSLGRTDLYYRIQGIQNRGTEVSIPVPPKKTFWFLPETLRLARWDEKAGTFRIEPDSRFEAKSQTMTAVLTVDGTYTVLGLSRVDRVLAAQFENCRFRAAKKVWPGCREILCLPMDIDSSGVNWVDSLGIFIDEVGSEFGNLCERCLDSWVPGAFPECEIIPGTVDSTLVIPTKDSDLDNDDLSNELELAIGTNPLNPDTDGDGLKDGWEFYGYDSDANGTRDIDLPGMGTNPARKDILVEIDWMFLDINYDGDMDDPGEFSFEPQQAAIDYVVEVFANSPVSNPNGVTGINLIVNISNKMMFRDMMNKLVITMPNGDAKFTALFDSIKTANITTGMEAISRYSLWINKFDTKESSGQAEVPGPSANFVVSLGGWGPTGGTQDIQQGTFMHELGHTLGLYHSGTPATYLKNYEPNYPSVMNYFHMFGGVTGNWSFGDPPVCPPVGPDNCYGSNGDPDGMLCFMPYDVCEWTYSRGLLPDVDEKALSEHEGISILPGPVDWDLDGAIGDTLVTVDFQIDGVIDLQTDHDDWSSLIIPF